MEWPSGNNSVSVTMSDDEDEELAMLRLQALMSKRRGGSGASKDLPLFHLPLSLPPPEPAAPVTTEAPLTITPLVVTSAPSIAPVPLLPSVNNSGSTYPPPHTFHGQQRGCGEHPQFPGVRGGFQRGPPSSSNLIVIQVAEDTEPEQRVATVTQSQSGPRPQQPASLSTTSAALPFLRPQDKWEAKLKDTAKPKLVTKFSRYNESSDSEESDTSESDSSSDDDADVQPAASEVITHPTDGADVDVGSRDSVNGDGKSEQSPAHVTDAEGLLTSTSQTDLPAKSRLSSISHDSDSSSSSDHTPPSPIRTPLQLESNERFSSKSGTEFRKGNTTYKSREQMGTRISLPLQRNESSSFPSRRDIQSSIEDERSCLQPSVSRADKNSYSASDLQSLSHPYSETSSSYQHSTALDPKKSPVRPRLSEHRPPSDNRSASRSRSPERRQKSQAEFLRADNTDRRKYDSNADNFPRSRSRSFSPPDKTSVHGYSPSRQRLQSRENLSRAPGRQMGRKSRSRSTERLGASAMVQSPSQSRSQSPLRRSPFQGRTRSGSVDRSSVLPSSRSDPRLARHLDSEVSDRSLYNTYKDVTRRRPSRSMSRDTDIHKDVSPERNADRWKSSPYRRSPDRTEKQPRTRSTDFERQPSRSPPSSSHNSPRKSPFSRVSPDQRDKSKPSDDRQFHGRYRPAASVSKDSIYRALPQVQDRSGVLTYRERKRSTSSDRNLASSSRSPHNRESNQNSRRVRQRLGRSPQRRNEVMQSRSQVGNRYSPSLPDPAATETKTNLSSSSPGRQTNSLPVGVKSKPATKSELRHSRGDGSQSLAEDRHGQNLTDSPSEYQRTSAGQSKDSSVVQRLKKLAEPDSFVQGNSETMTESNTKLSRCPPRERPGSQNTEKAKIVSAHAEPGVISPRKPLALKRPAITDASVLDARKRRFEQIRDTSQRSVCVRTTSDTRIQRHTRRSKQSSPVQHAKSKQLDKDLKKAVDTSEIMEKSEESGVQKTAGKVDMDVSDISDLSSAESSMSLEDISEDESPRVRDKRFGERSAQELNQHLSGVGQVQKKEPVRRKRDGETVTHGKRSMMSSVVKPVKKDADVSKARGAVETVTQSSPSTTEAQPTTDSSSSSDDGVVIKSPHRNVVRKDAGLFDIATQQKLRPSVHSRLGSVATTSDTWKTSTRKMVGGGDLRQRLRGVEPSSDDMSQQMETSQLGRKFASKRQRRRR